MRIAYSRETRIPNKNTSWKKKERGLLLAAGTLTLVNVWGDKFFRFSFGFLATVEIGEGHQGEGQKEEEAESLLLGGGTVLRRGVDRAHPVGCNRFKSRIFRPEKFRIPCR